MPERGFDTGYWSEPFAQKLPAYGKLLLVYLSTNSYGNPAGLYYITLDTIAFDTKIPEGDLPGLLELLEPEVFWDPEESLIWVKSFIKKQAKSPKFLAAAAKYLTTINNNNVVHELLKYNMSRYSISIPYQYYIDRVSILTRVSVSASVSGSVSDKRVEVVKGKGEKPVGEIPPSKSEAEENLSEGDRGVISVWRSVEGFDLGGSTAKELVARLRTEFTDLDILAESKAWAARKLTEPLKPGSRPSQQIWNWMRLARKFAEERRSKGEQSKSQRVTGKRPPSDFSGGKW